ncbi:MAG: RnfABCDGE type electron transport complex subunit D [Clostridia bacterium]|nr:RnfABCDGE type electron transport complex subunit D [Clostridia bacterium]
MTFSVSNAPHARHQDTTQRIMLDVLIALAPTAIAGCFLFGWNAARVIALSVVFCVGLEYLWQKLMHKPVRIADLSAAVTGVIFALNMPSTAPWWMLLIGCAVAILLVKQLFGGIGSNFVNPALAARAVLLSSWPGLMGGTAFHVPFDTVSSATPLVSDNAKPMLDLFLGRIPGTIGEVCKVAILLGLAYLLIRRTIMPVVPVVMVGSYMVFAALFGQNAIEGVLTGGLLFGAVFMATDYVTSPMTLGGNVVYALGAGLMVALIRRFGSTPEGVTYAILLMNIVTPLLDRGFAPRIYGTKKEKKEAKTNA